MERVGCFTKLSNYRKEICIVCNWQLARDAFSSKGKRGNEAEGNEIAWLANSRRKLSNIPIETKLNLSNAGFGSILKCNIFCDLYGRIVGVPLQLAISFDSI